MKQFLSKYSHKMVTIFVTQFALSIFGNVLFFATARINPVSVLISVFAVLFNLFLVYTSMWELGSKDKPAIDAERTKLKPTTGLFIALGAYIPTFILTVAYAIILPVPTQLAGTAADACLIVRLLLLLVNGAYTGIMSAIPIGSGVAFDYWWFYIIISIPTIAVCTVAYVMGAKGIHFTKLMLPLTPEEQEIKREKKLERKKKN